MKRLFIILLILFMSATSYASEAEKEVETGNAHELRTIVVTADRQNEPIDQVTKPITYVPREDIVTQQAQSASEVLGTELGVDVISFGAPGDDTTIRIRGSDTDEVLVLVDNVPINTVIDNRPTIVGTIPASFIDHMEIVRGAESSMYGSRAVGGVINIITRKGTEGIHGDTGFHGGNLGRYIGDAAFSLGEGNHKLRIAYQRWDQYGRFFNDALAQNAVNLNWHYQWTPEFSVALTPTYIQTLQQLAYDVVVEGNTVYFPRDRNRRLRRDTLIAPIAFELHAFPWWDSYLEYSLLYQFVRLKNPPTGDIPVGNVVGDQYYRSNEYRHRFSFRNVFTPVDHKGFRDRITVGFDVDAEEFSFKNGPYAGPLVKFPQPGQTFNRRNDAVYVQNVIEYKKYLIISGGFRFDHNTLFEDALTARAAVLLRQPTWGTTLKASYNETFNAPLIMLLNFVPGVQKETAQNYSVGIEQDLWKRGLFQVYFFYTDYDNYFFDNADIVGTDDAYAMGIETAVDVRPIKWLRLRASYAWTRARDEVRNVPLPNRPTHRWTFIGDVEPVKRLNLELRVDVVRTRYWGTNTALTFINANGVASNGKLSPYVKMDFAATYTLLLKKIAKSIQFDAKVENMLNQDYEERFGSPMPGINFLAGATATF